MNNQSNITPKKRLPMWSVDNFRYSKMTLDQATQAIKDYWTGGLLAVVGTLLFYSNRPQFGLILYDVAIMAVLVIFIYLKHRWAGVMFLVYFLISKIAFFLEFRELITPYPVIMSLLFSLFFFRGTLGLFKYNYLRRNFKDNNLSMYDKNGNCKQCGHPFDPHLIIALDAANPTKGGIIKCPVTNCPCHHTWDFEEKK